MGGLLTAVGGFSFVALSSILPIVIHYSVFKQTMSRKQIMEHLVLFVISCVIMVVASFFSLKELITKVKMGNCRVCSINGRALRCSFLDVEITLGEQGKKCVMKDTSGFLFLREWEAILANHLATIT